MLRGLSGPSRKGAWRVASTAVVVVLAIAVLTPAGARGSVAPQSILRIVAPFHGTWWPYHQVTAVGCAASKITKTPAFSLATGIETYAATASGRSCKATGTVFADAYIQVHATVKVPYHAGSPSLYANLSWAWNGNLTLKGGTCRLVGTPSYASCNRESQVTITGYVYFDDLTTNTQLGSWTLNIGSNATINDTSCSSSSCGSSTSGKSGPVGSSGKFSASIPSAGLNKGDRYALLVDLVGDADVSFNTYNMVLSGASGSSTVDALTHGNGLVLSSIVLT